MANLNGDCDVMANVQFFRQQRRELFSSTQIMIDLYASNCDFYSEEISEL